MPPDYDAVSSAFFYIVFLNLCFLSTALSDGLFAEYTPPLTTGRKEGEGRQGERGEGRTEQEEQGEGGGGGLC
jgi:hypothetical protein